MGEENLKHVTERNLKLFLSCRKSLRVENLFSKEMHKSQIVLTWLFLSTIWKRASLWKKNSKDFILDSNTFVSHKSIEKLIKVRIEVVLKQEKQQ